MRMALLMTLLLAWSLAAASSQSSNSPVSLVEVKAISVSDLWHAGSPQTANGDGAGAIYWAYDPETLRSVGKHDVCGLLLLGSPDLDSKPIGFEVRSRLCGFRLIGGRVGRNEALRITLARPRARQEIVMKVDGSIFKDTALIGKADL